MKFKPKTNIILLDSDQAGDDPESIAAIDKNTHQKPTPKPKGKSKSPRTNDDQSGPTAPDESRINDLVAKADLLYRK